MDAWIQANLGREFDAEGAWQNKGSINPELLATFLQDAYFAAKPPKSTGKEHFNQIWLDQHLDDHLPPNPADVQATLAQLTAVSIAQAIERWSTRAGQVITCGGGRLNPPLIDKLAAQLPNHLVCASESLGVNGDWLEAAAFAYLAHRRLEGLPGNVPTVTGAAGERVLGGVYFP
jgi:anhydro-N-acetylmuramic acid kinase